MNLNMLSSALPKEWLEISCNKLTTNELVVPAIDVDQTSFFSANLTGPGVPLLSLTATSTAANNLLCGSNASFSLASNSYTCPQPGFIYVTLFVDCSANALTSYTLSLQLNGGIVDKASSVRLAAGTNVALTLPFMLSVAQGDVLTYVLSNDQAPNPLSIDVLRFCGKYL